MTRHFTRKLAVGLLSVVGIVLVFALMMALLPISLPTASADPDPDEVYIPAGWSRVSSDTDFAGAVALGGKRAIDRDIKINTTYRLTMSADLQLDLNGFSVSHGPNYSLLQIYTNGYNLSLFNSNPGKGTFNATIVVEVGPSDEKSNIVIADDVAVAGITIHRKTAYEGGFCFDQIKLLNGSLRFFQYYEDESVDPNYKAGFYNNETRQNEFKSKFEFGQVGNYYVDGVKVADADAFWEGFEWGDYSCSAKKLAFLKPRAAINTALGAEMIQTPTAEQNGWASVTTAYEDDAYARTQNNNVYAHKWFRSVNGGGYQECNAYNGNYSNDGYELIDKNIELGAKSYTYYAELTDASWLGDIKTNSEKITIYSAPLAPLDVVVDGPHSVNVGTEVILKGHYTVNPYNVDTNIIKYEYKWQKLDSDEGVYYDIAGSGKMTYRVNTATTGRQGFRFCVRAAGKGDQFSEWAPSAYFEVVVGAYDSPVVSLPALELEGIAGDAATLTATVDNADYFDEIEYQWYYLNPNGIYLKLKESSWGGYTFADVDEATLSITRSNALDEALAVRCQVTGTKNGYKRSANSADVSVTFIDLPAPTITIQPQGATLQRANTTYALAVFATTRKGELSYQWQSSSDNTNWENLPGETAYNYQADRSVTDNAGTYYRCVVSNAAGSTPSEAALIRVKDGTILNATLVQGLEARAVGELLDGGEIDNASRTLICHLGDTILIGFTASNGNASNSESSVGTDWRKVTGLSENGMGEYYVDTSMAGTFEYYGRYLAEYDDGDGIVQSILYDRTNDERMRYKVIVLPNEDDIEMEPILMNLGESATITIGDYAGLFANGGSVTTSSHALLYGNNWASSVYRLVRGYRLFVGIPSEEEGVQYVCVAQAGYYYQPEAASYYYEGEPIEFDTSDEALAALGIETLDGAYDAYLVMDYQLIVDEDDDGLFIIKQQTYEGHHFLLTVQAPCQHEYVTTTYRFDYSDPAEPTIFVERKCDVCEQDLAGFFIRIYSEEDVSGLALVPAQEASCTQEGVKAHKHFVMGEYDVYYVLDEDDHWVVCDDPDSLFTVLDHDYQGIAQVDATCQADGVKAHYVCNMCSALFVYDGDNYYEVSDEDLVIDAFHKSLQAIAEVPATCSEFGVAAHYFCSHCEHYFVDSEGIEEIADLDAWKAAAGKLDKLPHSFEWVVDQPATKTATGLKHEECTVCHEHRNDGTVIPVADCDHNGKQQVAAVPATCTTAGKAAYWHCNDCNRNFSDEACQLPIEDLAAYGIVEALGHEWGEWHVVTPATESEDGLEERVCAHDASHKETRAITASGFSYRTEGGVKIFDHAATLGHANDLTALFAAAKAAEGKVEITAGDLSLTFDKAAVAAISGNVVLNVNLYNSGMGIQGAQLVIELSLGNVAFAGGSVHVKVPFATPVPDGKVAKVYYVNGEAREDMHATFAGGFVEFDTPHFSTFAVIFEDEQQVGPAPVGPGEGGAAPKGGLSGGAIAGIVIAILAVVAGCAVAVVLVLKKKKSAPAPKADAQPEQPEAPKAEEEAAPQEEEAPAEEAKAEEPKEE